jgi:hypothetical protein
MYKILQGAIKRLSDGASIAIDPGNIDYQQYLKWRADGGIPEPEYTPEELAAKEAEDAKMAKMLTAASAIRQIPGWATWTPQEAIEKHRAAVTDRITNLAIPSDAKLVLLNIANEMEKMITMLCYLRDHGGI